MLIDGSVVGLAQFCEKLQKYCVLQYFVGIDLLMLCKVRCQKMWETICGLIRQNDNRSVFCGLESWSRLCQKVWKCCKLEDFVRFYNVRTARVKMRTASAAKESRTFSPSSASVSLE